MSLHPLSPTHGNRRQNTQRSRSQGSTADTLLDRGNWEATCSRDSRPLYLRAKKKPNRDTLDRLAPGKPLVLFPHIIFACMSRHTRFFCQLCLLVSHVCHALLQVCMLVTMQVPYSQELCYRNNLPYRHAHTNIPKVFHAILKCGCNCCQ